MKTLAIASSLVLAGSLVAVSAHAQYPYASWQSSDDDMISIADSFNRETTVSKSFSQDNDVDVRKHHSEDNDVSIQKEYSSVYTSSEDNDVSKSWYQTTDVDSQVATPTLTSFKFQQQDAGHQADTSVYGTATGHSVGVEGGTNFVSAGNDETRYYGPALVNTNTNQLPQNNLFIQGSNGAPISQANTFAGRDLGPKGVFAPIGNTSAQVGGNVGNQSGASVDQSGDAANSIADPMSSVIGR